MAEASECGVCFRPLQGTDRIEINSGQCCLDCCKAVFVLATDDESMFPPKLFGAEVSLDIAQAHLTRAELDAFETKAAEWRTKLKDRLYCSRESCSAYLGPANLKTTAITCTISKCSRKTCSACRKAWHPKRECSDEVEVQALCSKPELNLQECQNCGRPVELRDGCNHMRVRP